MAYLRRSVLLSPDEIKPTRRLKITYLLMKNYHLCSGKNGVMKENGFKYEINLFMSLKTFLKLDMATNFLI